MILFTVSDAAQDRFVTVQVQRQKEIQFTDKVEHCTVEEAGIKFEWEVTSKADRNLIQPV